MDKLRLIKGIVVLLTSLIVIGIAAVIIGLATKDSRQTSATIPLKPANVVVPLALPTDSPATNTGTDTDADAGANANIVVFPARSTATTSGKETLLAEPLGSDISSITSCGNNLCALVTGGGVPARILVLNDKGVLLRTIKITFSN